MRTKRLALGHLGIDRNRETELRAFCRQYREKKQRAASLLGIQAVAQNTGGRAKGLVSDPVGRAAAKREGLLDDVRLIERAARQVDGGRWFSALIRNVCYGIGYTYLDAAILPTSCRSDFFRARREFFWRLDQLKERRDWQREADEFFGDD